MFFNLRLNFLLLLLWLLFSGVCMASGKESTVYCFKQISTEDGLSQSTVRCILNDHNGIIWIGTKNGLNKFDQYELKNYYHEDSVNSLPDNCINFITEDSLHNIWIGTDKGLALYDRKKDTFIPIYLENKPLVAHSFYHSPEGVIFGGVGTLYIYENVTREIRKLKFSNKAPEVKYNHIMNWTEDLLIIVSRYDGVYTFNKKNSSIKKLPYFSKKDIAAIYIDKHKRIWFSPYREGLYCLNSRGEQILHITQSNSNLNNDIILDIIERDGDIWLATDGGGINIYNPISSKIKIINEEVGEPYSLPEKSILCLYNDVDNNLWAGSIRGGLLRIKEAFIQTYKSVPLGNPYGLSDRVVTCLFEETNGALWIGTDGGGINLYDPHQRKFTHYPETYPNKVVSIIDYSPEQLMLSFFDKGIYLFNKRTKVLSPFVIVDQETNAGECTVGRSVYLDRCSKDKILILGKRVYIYDISSQAFSTIKDVDKESQLLLQKITTGEDVAYLMGQYSLVKLNCTNSKMEILYDNRETMGLEAAVYDGKESIWIGTNNGLYNFNLRNKQIQKIETNLFHGVSSLNYDDRERLWIGAQNMLFCYIPNENRFIILGESDGVYPNELFPMTTYKSFTNTLYLGGASGLVCINKDIMFESDALPTVQLADVIINGVSRLSELTDNSKKEISVPWNTSSIEIKLSTKEKDIFRKKIFRYNIAGMNNQYIESYNRTLSLVALPPGDYTIMVSCNSQSGTWSKPISVLHISVAPPIWKARWFIGGCILLAIMLVVGIAYLIIRKNKNRLKWRMKEHEKDVDEEKIRFLINVSHELRTPLTLIYAPLKRILERKNVEDSELMKELVGIFKRARQMKNIINMVLDVRKIEVGQEHLRLESQHLNQWIRSVGNDFLNEFEAKSITLNYDLDPTLSHVSFDSSKCEIVLSNLLMNSLKYSGSNTQVNISTRLVEDGKMVRVAVEDQGIGLDGVDLNKLFTRFYRGNYDRNGSGIGLSYAKILIEMHKGRIGALGREGAGAIFYFDLPCIDAPAIISCPPKPYLNELLYSEEQIKLVDTGTFETNSFTVLVVEDDADLNSFLQTILKDYFSHVYTAMNGREALDVLMGCTPDVVVSDVMMPQMDGFELCKRIKNDLSISHIPIVLLTARNDTDSNVIGYKMGADAYLSKPFETEFLITVIRNLLRNREQIKQRYRDHPLSPVPQELTISNADEHFLLKLNELICDNIENPSLDVKFMTESMAMSRASLYKKVKVLTDMGVNDYINKLRIEKAVDLLSSTDLSITEVSEQAGFTYQRYFSSVFKEIKGVTPSKFRQGIQK